MWAVEAVHGAALVDVVGVVHALVALFATRRLDGTVAAVRSGLAHRRAATVGRRHGRGVGRTVVAVLIHRLQAVTTIRIELAHPVAVHRAVADLRAVAHVVAA